MTSKIVKKLSQLLPKIQFTAAGKPNVEPIARQLSSASAPTETFKFDDLRIELGDPSTITYKPDFDNLTFGHSFSDHMLRIQWSQDRGWHQPVICKLEDLRIHPGAKVLHYAQELFEGMKAYRGVDGQIRLFRPMHNMTRMLVSAQRSCLPEFDRLELVHCIRKLVEVEQEWVPHSESSSLYIRPTMIGTEPTLGVSASKTAELYVLLSPTGPYFATGLKPVNLLADPKYVRAWPGGSGYSKMGSNYAPTLWIGEIAQKHDCQQALWLFGPDEEITEVGAMNIFAFFQHPDGRKELVTPSLESGLILPGVTRRSVLELAEEWNEFDISERKLTIHEVLDGAKNGTLLEMFGTGTAAIVSPVGNILYDGEMKPLPVPEDENSLAQRILKTLSAIYYGEMKHPWAFEINNWNLPQEEEARIESYRQSLLSRMN